MSHRRLIDQVSVGIQWTVLTHNYELVPIPIGLRYVKWDKSRHARHLPPEAKYAPEPDAQSTFANCRPSRSQAGTIGRTQSNARTSHPSAESESVAIGYRIQSFIKSGCLVVECVGFLAEIPVPVVSSCIQLRPASISSFGNFWLARVQHPPGTVS